MAKFTVPTPIPPPVRPRNWPNPQLTFSRPSTAFSTVPVFTITGDDAIAESPTPIGNFNLFGSGSITTTGSTNTETISLIGLTNHNVLVGAGTSTIGLIAPSTAGFVLTSNGPGSDPTFQANSGGSAIMTITGNTGGAESPLAGNFNVLGTGSITVAGSANTETVQLTGLTNHNVLVGAGTATISNVSPSATSGVPLISQGSSADPVFGTAVVAGGGTGDTSFTEYAPVCGGTTTTGALQSASTGLATSGFVLTSNGSAALPSFQTVAASGAVTTITGDSGGPESPSSGNFNILGSGSITTVGSANTETVELTGLTNHNVLVGAGTTTITKVPPSATSGVPLISQGAASDPAFGTAVVSGGGTGDTSFTAYAVICGGTTSTNPLQSIAGVGSSGQVLTSNGAGLLPTFQAASASGAVTTLTGDTGGAISPTAGNITLNANTNGGATVKFSGTGSTISLLVTNSVTHDTFIGLGAGVAIATSGGNTSVGYLSSQALDASSSGNAAFGSGALALCTSGSNNTALGLIALNSLTTGSTNTVIGEAAGSNFTTGSNNTLVGVTAGISYTTSESSNIIIRNNGTVGESNAIRIGTTGSGAGQQNKCFIAGIASVSVSNTQMVTIDTTTGQMGSQTIPTGMMTWTNVTGTSQTIAVNNGYLSNNAGTVAFTLPASATIGDVFRIAGVQGAWTLAQAANQQIKFGNTATTVGVTGSLASANAGDSLECVATNTSASTVWRVISSIGNITVA